jgi:hypothetical protein
MLLLLLAPAPLHSPAQVLAVIKCRAGGSLSTAMGLSPTTAVTNPVPSDHPNAAAAGDHCLWGRVVLMQLEGSGVDAVSCSSACSSGVRA